MLNDITVLNLAASHAAKHSTCIKVAVGAAFRLDDDSVLYSCNHGDDINCKKIGECHKFKVTGIYESCEETRKYCAAKHAEINLLEDLKSLSIDPKGQEIFVTRYPCINCARALVEAGVKVVTYGGRQEISDEVKQLFNDNNVKYKWYPECDYEG